MRTPQVVGVISHASSLRAVLAPLTVALIVVSAARTSDAVGEEMSPDDVQAIQAQGVREIIIKRDPTVPADQQARLRAQAGVTYVGAGPLPDTEVDRAPAGRVAVAIDMLQSAPQIQYAEPNGQVHATANPNDTYFPNQWGLSNTGQPVQGAAGAPGDDIGATYAWPHSTGVGVTVAVVDTGVDPAAPDLQGRLVGGYDFINNTATVQDQNGHGTHVGGIIAAAQNNSIGVSGVAPGARLMPLRALDASGTGTLDNVAAAFNYAGNHNVPIVNASLGGNAPSQTLEDAISSHPNTLYVVAAGNDGSNDDTTPFYPCDFQEQNLICVAASDQNDQRASFSNYGAGDVDLFAPGVNILSTWTDDASGHAQYYYASGTSMATPLVSGTLALMAARKPSLSATLLRSDLLASVDQEPQLAGGSAAGGGLDAAAAVAMAGGDAAYGAPGSIGLPTVSGPPAIGALLVASPGGWSRQPTTYSYQWQRCRLGACLPIAGATTSTYRLGSADDGATINVVVRATNAAGSAKATSVPTGTVGAPSSLSSSPQASTPPAPGSANPTMPAPIPGARPGRHATVRLTRVSMVGKRDAGSGRSAQALEFTLSGPARVQINFTPSGRPSSAASPALRVFLSGRRGTNHYSLSSLLRGRLLHGRRYAVTVRTGGQTVALWLTVP